MPCASRYQGTMLRSATRSTVGIFAVATAPRSTKRVPGIGRDNANANPHAYDITGCGVTHNIGCDPHEFAMRVREGLWLSRATWLAACFRLADVVGDGPASAAEIAEASGTHLDSLERLMRVLAAEGVFRITAEHRGGVARRGPRARTHASEARHERLASSRESTTAAPSHPWRIFLPFRRLAGSLAPRGRRWPGGDGRSGGPPA